MLLESLNKFIQNICMYVTLPFGSQRFPRISPRSYLPFPGFSSFVAFFYWNEHLPQCCLLHLLIYLLIYLCLLALHCWTKKKNIPLCFQKLFKHLYLFQLSVQSNALLILLGLRELLSLDGDAVHGATRGRNNPILVCVCCYSLLCSLPTFLALFKFIYLCFFFADGWFCN